MTRRGDGSTGWPARAPFDRILVTAAAPVVPEGLTDQLCLGGVILVPVGADGGVQTIIRLRRDRGGLFREDLWPVRFVPLVPGIPVAAWSPA